MSVVASVELLRAQLERCVAPAAYEAFSAQLANFARNASLSEWLTAFSGASRQLGRTPVPIEAHGPGSDRSMLLVDCGADTLGRALLLLQVAQTAAEQLETAVWDAYREGDTLEKIAVVRSLALLPGPERFVELALDAGRTNDARLFRAVACDNPFPADHYSELEWNKLVMKAAFVGAPLERMLGTQRRANAELSRMALEYIEEQESASRSFPAAIMFAVAAYPRPGAVAKLLGYASHAIPELRLYAVRALTPLRQARTQSFLRERLDVENDERVQTALRAILHDLSDERSSP